MATPPSIRVFSATRALLQGFGFAIPAVAVADPLYNWAAGEPLEREVRVQTDLSEPVDPLPGDGVEIIWDERAWITLADAGVGDRLLAALPHAVLGLAIGASLLILARLLGRIAVGTPFIAASVLELRLLALTVLAAGLLVPPLSSFVEHHLVRDALAGVGSVPLSATVHFAWVGVAVLTFALAQAFEQGARTERDVEGLV